MWNLLGLDASIGKRLGWSQALVLLVALAGSGLGYLGLSGVADATRSMYEDSLVTERLASDWYRVVFNGTTRTTAIAASEDASLATFFAKDATEASKQSSEFQSRLDKLLTTPKERAVFDKVGALRKRFISLRDQISEAKKAGDADRAKQLFSDFVPASREYLEGIRAVAELQREQLDEQISLVVSSNLRARAALAGFSAVALLVGIGIAVMLTRSITRPLNRAVQAADAIARFDLSDRIDASGRDETGQLLRAMQTMQSALVRLIGEVRGSSDSISTASNEIAVGNMDLSGRTEQTASNLQQAAASLTQLTGTVRQTADSATTANQLAVSAVGTAQQGGTLMKEVVSTMGEISESSRRIHDIIGVIDGIAFQTNILALNAAVEAARAGEQGRGFAVVAGEVRSLAQRSASAAREIKTLIASSVERVDSGSALVSNAGATMERIVQSVQRVSDLIAEISASAREQSQGIGEVHSAVGQLDEMTQRNAALVEEAASAAESLKEQTHRLVEAVSVFRLAR